MDTTNLGEKPEVFMDGIQQVIYVTAMEEIRWKEARAKLEAEKLAEKSNQIFSAWEIARLIPTLKDGEYIGADNSGQLFVGKMRPNKMRKIGKIVPRHIPSNFDTQYDLKNPREEMVTKSFVYPSTVFGFKSSWDTMRKSKSNSKNPLVDFFLDEIQEIMADETLDWSLRISFRTVTTSFGTSWIEITIKDYPIICCFNEYGAIRYYIHDGKKFEL